MQCSNDLLLCLRLCSKQQTNSNLNSRVLKVNGAWFDASKSLTMAIVDSIRKGYLPSKQRGKEFRSDCDPFEMDLCPKVKGLCKGFVICNAQMLSSTESRHPMSPTIQAAYAKAIQRHVEALRHWLGLPLMMPSSISHVCSSELTCKMLTVKRVGLCDP